MGHFISLISVMLIGASGILTIYLVIDFFEYLKKYHGRVWDQLCFERPFGIPQKDFFFYPVKPLKFIPFLLSNDDPPNSGMVSYKVRIKYALIGLVAAVFLNIIINIFV